MGPKKLPLDTSESDSEELPTFTFLKQKPSLTKNSQVVVHSSDAECSSSSPGSKELPALQEAARTVSPEEPATVLSSENEEEEELIPLVQRLQCRTTYSFSKAQESGHQDSSSQIKCALNHQHNEGTAEEWKEQPFPKTLVLSNSSSVKDASKNDRDVEEEPHNYVPAFSSVFPVQIRNVSATEKSSVLSPPPKRTKYTQKEKGKGWQGPLQTQRKQKESEQRQQERERKKALANMLKAQKPEECLKHITVVLDPALLQLDGGGQVLSALQAMECHCAIEAQTIPYSITWKRRAILSQVEEGNLTEEPFVLVLLQEKEFMTMIYNSKQALVELQLHTEAQIRILKSWKELADFICMFTKAVAEAPFKRSRDQTNFSFCLASDWAGGVKVDWSGKGLKLVWRRQIQQLNRVSLEIASAIVSAYPSPRLLLQAYQQCLSEQECHNLLADIQVRRGEGVTTTSRRVGPELSRRIYFQMTTLQPDFSLDGTE
ncbi:structure-specific endonuclease subunit EME1 isoform X2 [Phascolarctos cinereus]|uniref:Crossover junction endonuclease EME1 isoform X2 n=1 Tax=Phascolarctos cinereus TaxID=38626 RepID=A0A6P5J1L8_PHACI|nr:crossover junction endonuclease EME1 isoform X2 [Phascolarctos cinereus]